MKSPHSTVVILLLIAAQIEQTVTIVCGRLVSYHNHFGQDDNDPIKRWPWLAVIYHQGEKLVPDFLCGGTIINSKSILTAAHCVAQFNDPTEMAQVSVSLGRLNLSDLEGWAQNFKVADVILHPNFKLTDLRNDIAIVQLASVATFNYFVQPICLWSANRTDMSDVIDSEGTVTVWGRTETNKSDLIQQAFTPVVPSRTCHSRIRDFTASETKFCASFRNGTRVCDEDSGGSVAFQENGSYHIRGIVSQSLCDSTSYTIFTDIAKYLPWIREVAIGCEKKVLQCKRVFRNRHKHLECEIRLNIEPSEQKCKIVFTDPVNTNVTWLHISGVLKALPDLSDALQKFENIRALQLTGKKLKIVERSKLSAFSRIQILNLENNEIAEFAADTFDDLKNLTDLGLQNNELKLIHPDLLKELRSLTVLYLSGNKLEVLPKDLFRNNKMLETISVNDNKIIVIHPEVFQVLENLEELQLHGNELEILPENLFRNNRKLKRIELSNNKIKEIPPSLFNDLGNPKEISLFENELEILPAALFRDNQQLEVVSLETNKYKVVHRDLFKELVNMKQIFLNGNELELLPEGLFRNNQQLMEISLQNNKIKEIHPDLFKELGSLKELYLYRNKLEILPKDIFRYNKKLEIIWAYNNKIRVLDRDLFEEVGNLTEIYLDGNELEILPDGLFRDNGKLEVVGLSRNKIKIIETDFQNLPSLSELNLVENDCIDVNCDVKAFCGTKSTSEMQHKIQDECPKYKLESKN